MLNKALPRVVSRAQRSFHSSASVSRIVATSPARAQETMVSRRTRSDPLFFIRLICSLGDLENTPSLNTSMTLWSCRWFSWRLHVDVQLISTSVVRGVLDSGQPSVLPRPASRRPVSQSFSLLEVILLLLRCAHAPLSITFRY